MKQIGYTDGATKDHVWRLTDDGMTSPHVLSVSDNARRDEFYIERDYLNVGWVFPADAVDNGGRIYSDKQGVNSVACFIKRAIELPTAPAERSPMDDARERITALEKAFVMLTSQSADVIEAQRVAIDGLKQQIREAFDYTKSLEKTMRTDTSGTAIAFRRRAALAALSGLCARRDTSSPELRRYIVRQSYEIADAMIAADEPTSNQAHTD